MPSLVIDEAVKTVLARLTTPTELRDKSGNILGVFTPARTHRVLSPDELRGLFDLEEAERVAATERQGYSLGEVMEHLRSLERQG